jgi:hypothetical protein
LEPFLQSVIDVASEKSAWVMGLDSAKTLAKATTQYMRASEAAKAIGVSVSRMHDAIHSGECEHRTLRMGTRGQLFEVPIAEVERIQQCRAEWISDAAACELAAITPAVLERMKAAGVIGSDVRWREDLHKGGPVERASLLALFEQINPCADGKVPKNVGTLRWSNFTSRRMGDKGAIEQLMKAIANGNVVAVARSRTLGDLSFRTEDVSRYFGTPLVEAGMSIQHLSQFTGWKWESISHWMDEGLLAYESIQLRGQPSRVVLPHQMLAFRQSFIPLADLARSMGMKASTLSLSLHGIELVGAKRLPDGAMRGGLLRVADLGRLAVIGAKAGNDLFVSNT